MITASVAAALTGHPEDVAVFRRARLGGEVPPVTLVADADLDGPLPDHWAARVTVKTRSGQTSLRVVDALGSPSRALPEDAVLKKFDTLTDGSLTRWRTRCLSLDDLDDVTDLVHAMSA